MTETHGCTGKCCAAFFLPIGPTLMEEGGSGPETDKIADMIVPLTNKEATERLKRFDSPCRPPRAEDEGTVFTCRHWDEDTRLCTIYETRPRMCRGYPYGNDCEHGCPHKGMEDWPEE